MTLTKYIAALEAIKSEHGDLDVETWDSTANQEPLSGHLWPGENDEEA